MCTLTNHPSHVSKTTLFSPSESVIPIARKCVHVTPLAWYVLRRGKITAPHYTYKENALATQVRPDSELLCLYLSMRNDKESQRDCYDQSVI